MLASAARAAPPFGERGRVPAPDASRAPRRSLHARGTCRRAGFQASIQTPGDIDWFQVHALSGVTYVLRTSLLGLSDSVLRVYEADGTTLIDENDDQVPDVDASSRVEITLDSDRDVKIQVTGFGSATGTYRLIAE